MDPTMGAGENLANVQETTETTTQESVADNFNNEVPGAESEISADIPTTESTDGLTKETAPESGAESPDFKMPDEYSSKSWAKGIESLDDALKMLDNAQSLIGKKQSGEIDVANMNDEQLQGLFEKVRPESSESYELHESIQGEELDVLRSAAHSAGLHPTQLNSVISDYRKYAQAEIEKVYDPEVFNSGMKDVFGDKYESEVNDVNGLMDKLVNPDVKSEIDKIPSAQRVAVYQAMANLKAAYGATEGGMNNNTSGTNGFIDPKVQYDNAYKELMDLQSSPHTQEQRQAVLNKLYAAQDKLNK